MKINRIFSTAKLPVSNKKNYVKKSNYEIKYS